MRLFRFPLALRVLRLLPCPALLLVLVLGTVSGACSNQPEGEVCDPNASNSGNDDCQDGLTCQQAPGVPNGSANPYRCCPPDLAQATTAACSQSTTGLDASSAPPDASGDVSTAAGDGSSEASTSDAGRDGAPVSDASDAAPE